MALEFRVDEYIGILSEKKSTRIEVRRVSWNGDPPKLDIRSWFDDAKKPGKGIPLTDLEAALLRDILIRLDLPAPTVDYIELARARSAVQEVDK
ncbi:MAG: PC4/YdbC family ssDNA-binding protein [Clostridiales bacterium]|nr:PC4/YdbC family ssDNA-binding protein [Clostridiales bacterium]